MPGRRKTLPGSGRITVGTRYRRPKDKKARGRPKVSLKDRYLDFLKRMPAVLAGKARRDTLAKRRLYNTFWSSVILSLFTDIYKGYEEKSEGQTDDLGVIWADISPKTKAYKRPKRGLLTGNQRRKYLENTPGLLTPSQYKLWKRKFAEVMRAQMRAKARGDRPESESELKVKAAQSAWNYVKKRGAETLIGTLGKKDMLIMRVTDRLYNSLKPGKINNLKYVRSGKDQVVRLSAGSLVIGTSVPYAEMAASRVGKEKRGKKREFLPQNLGIWYDNALEAGRNALTLEIKSLAKKKKLLT